MNPQMSRLNRGWNPNFTEPAVDQTIFNHDILNCTHDEVLGNHLFSGRALGLTESRDIIQLHPDLKSQWPFITRHYRHVGLSFTESVIWDTSYELLAHYQQFRPSFFFYGEDTFSYYANYDFHNIVTFINSKNNFIDVARQLELPVPQTFCYDNKALIDNTSIFPYPCFVKTAVSVAGVGITRCKNETELLDTLNRFENDVPLQIQQEIKALKFLNVQYRVKRRGVERFAITEQFLEGYTHVGNRYPTVFDCWHVTDPYANFLADRGIKGIFAFDVAVYENNGRIDYCLIECNPRFNGASYPTWIAKKLGLKEWSSESFVTTKRSLKDLDMSNIEYRKSTGSGIILVNWGPILFGRFSVLLAGTAKQQDELRAELLNRL